MGGKSRVDVLISADSHVGETEDLRAQVVFPNISLDCGGGQSSSEYAVALATAYNDFVWDVFSTEPKRFKPAAMLPLDDLDQMQERRHLYSKKLPLRASEYFRRQGAITIGDDEVALRNVESIDSDCLLWGNDYPHDEGTWPESGPVIESIRESLGPERARAVLSGNAARIYGFDLEYLASNPLEGAS